MATSTIETHEGLPPQPKMSPGKWFMEIGWRHLLGLVAVVFAMFPLVYVVSASLNPGGTLTGSNQLFSTVSLDGYREDATRRHIAAGLKALSGIKEG